VRGFSRLLDVSIVMHMRARNRVTRCVLQSIKFSLSRFAVNGIAFHVPVLQ
jgi:hypothetical protein